jgi:DNA-binding beta-propeller fold protein YncE
MALEQLNRSIDFVADSPPSDANDGELFLDTSLSPPQVKVFDASVGSFVRPQTAQNLDQKVSAAGADLQFIGTFSLSDPSFSGTSFSVGAQDNDPEDVAFSASGEKMYIVGSSSDSVFEYSLADPFAPTTAVFTQSFDVSPQANLPTGVALSDTGGRMFIVDNTDNRAYQYNLSTPFDISTAAFDTSFGVLNNAARPNDISFSDTGDRMFIVADDASKISQFNLSTPFDISTAGFDSDFSVSGQESTPQGVTFSPSGDKMFLVGSGSNSAFQYVLTSPFEISTASFTGVSFDVATQNVDPSGIAFSEAGDRLFIIGTDSDSVSEYLLGRVGPK